MLCVYFSLKFPKQWIHLLIEEGYSEHRQTRKKDPIQPVFSEHSAFRTMLDTQQTDPGEMQRPSTQPH